MKSLTFFLLGLCLSCSCVASDSIQDVVGAGSTLSTSLMARVAQSYLTRSRVSVSYQSIGSGEGIRRVTAGTVDFALSDVPLTRYELDLLDALQVPVFFSAIVPVVNLPGLEQRPLVLDLEVLARIYLGQIQSWRDPALQALNPGRDLPDLPVVPVHRSDSSGSSYVFTDHLAHADAAWNDRLGVGSKLVWPTGPGAAGTAAVLRLVADTPGAIGYAEFGEAERARASVAALRSGDGSVLVARPETLEKAVAGVGLTDQAMRAEFADLPHGEGWPVMATTYAIVRRHAPDAREARAALGFVDWLLAEPAAVFSELGFVPLRDPALLARIRRQIALREAPASARVAPAAASLPTASVR